MTFTIDEINIGEILSVSGNLTLTEALSRQAYKLRLLRFVSVSRRLSELQPDVAARTKFVTYRDFLSTLAPDTQAKVIGYPSFVHWIRSAEAVLAKLAKGLEVPLVDFEAICFNFARFALAGAVIEDVDFPNGPPLNVKSAGRVFLPGSSAWLELSSLHDEAQLFAYVGRTGMLSFRQASEEMLCQRVTVTRLPRLRNGIEVNCWDPELRLLAQRVHADPEIGSPLVEEWLDSLNEACELISACHPTIYEEISRYVRVLIPIVPPDPTTSVSSSSPIALGLLWMSLNADIPTIAETIVHEYHHQKLNALLLVEPVIAGPTKEAIFYSPWRNDPRPLLGILHGAFAFGGVLDFYRRLAVCKNPTISREQVGERLHLLRNQVLNALDTLRDRADFTSIGQGLYAAMRRHAQDVPQYPISLSAKHRVEERLTEHWQRWSAANGDAFSSPASVRMHG